MKWIKIIICFFVVLISGCTKLELPTPEVIEKDNIFSIRESSVSNGQTVYFDLPTDGIYILTLADVETNQVISREKFTGQVGENNKKIYTNSIKSKSVYLSLEDFQNKEIGKTIITIKK